MASETKIAAGPEKAAWSAPKQHKKPRGDKKLGQLKGKVRGIKAHASSWKLLDTTAAGHVEAETSNEKTYRLTQKSLKDLVSIDAQNKIFDLKLDGGPYCVAYSRNGRFLALAGAMGHVATIDWRVGKLLCEFYTRERVRDIVWLHNELYFAVAQKKDVVIYDHNGLQLHRIASPDTPFRLCFLPYHFLLVTLTKKGKLTYMDTSDGRGVVTHNVGRRKFKRAVAELGGPTRRIDQSILEPGDVSIITAETAEHEPVVLTEDGLEVSKKKAMAGLGSYPTCMAVNPTNAVILIGHADGTVTMWTPNIGHAVVTMLCHKGPVSDLSVSRCGRFLVTGGADGFWRSWQLSNFTLKQSYLSQGSVTSVSVSQLGLVAVASGSQVEIWPKIALYRPKVPLYMRHVIPGSPLERAYFVPYDDVLGLGHVKGASSILIPGSGEPNYDAYEVNPFATTKQRQEAEVQALLDKLSPSLITLDTSAIASVAETDSEDDGAANADIVVTLKRRMKGRGSSLNIERRKSVIRDQYRRAQLQRSMEADKKGTVSASNSSSSSSSKKHRGDNDQESEAKQPEKPYHALGRFGGTR